MHWRLRILRGTIYSHVPFGAALRRAKRLLRPPTDESPSTRFAIADGLRQLSLLSRPGVRFPTSSLLEMGTGWLPVIPLLFHMAGYRRIVLTDTEKLMDDATVEIAKRSIRRRLPEIAKELGMTEEAAMAALERPFQPEYRAPWDPQADNLSPVDMLISRCVFEHVPPAELEECLAAFRKVVRPGGVMCHVVDNSDHWQHLHHARSPVQFLTWPKGGLIERFATLNRYGYTNRLRHSDYIEMFRRTGWEIVTAEGEPDPRSLKDLQQLRPAPPFDTRDASDLAILYSCFVVRNPVDAVKQPSVTAQAGGRAHENANNLGPS
ncbi:class I SAM-dependent methyltransferase [Sabulicella rubraurantiaca]|uniref:class I SAM-dependent methyltransferase n=1 Tax=Sabulicella rubraurantiaca TaxID=2811429 RepID=UPI001A95DD3A|nr:class I SAM-dependent methyltransferase [Sabulicella rubraurantiaca]